MSCIWQQQELISAHALVLVRTCLVVTPRRRQKEFKALGRWRQKLLKSDLDTRRQSRRNVPVLRNIRKMKTTVFACVLVAAAVLAEVHGVPQGRAVEEEEKPIPGSERPFPTFDNGPLRKIREELIKNLSSIDFSKKPHFQLFNRSGIAGPGGLTLGSVYNTLLSGVHSLYQDLLNRQQAFINLLTCGNCVNQGWDAIMEVVQNVPELEWVYNPDSGAPATFFTAVHQNGTVTGIGGSVINARPVAEYAFGNDGIVHHLPHRHKKN